MNGHLLRLPLLNWESDSLAGAFFGLLLVTLAPSWPPTYRKFFLLSSALQVLDSESSG